MEFNEAYFLKLPDKIRYIENLLRKKTQVRFVYIFNLVSDLEKTKIMKRFAFRFNKDIWDYISETEKDEKNLEYFSHKVNWNTITKRVIDSLNTKNEDDKIFSEEFIGNNLGKLFQRPLLEQCRFSNVFIKKYADNLDLDLVALHQPVSKTMIKFLSLNPVGILKNKYIKTIEKDWFPSANWQKFLMTFDGLTLEMVKKLSNIFNENITLLSILMKNPKNSEDLQTFLSKSNLETLRETLGISDGLI
jgi:hypothetical protein